MRPLTFRPTAEALEARETPALVSSAGVVYGLDDATGAVRFTHPLDPAFRGPLFVAGMSDGDILIGAGAGGGPRVVRFDWTTQREVWSVFVGDPASRTGVSVAAWKGYETALTARPAPADPGDPARVLDFASHLPDDVEAFLAPRVDVEVYGPPRPVGGFYYPGEGRISIHEGGGKFFAHEAGHAVHDFVSDEWATRWLVVFAGIDWTTYPAGGASVDYFRNDPHEAFAESFSLFVKSGGASLSAGVRGYFGDLFKAYHWRA